MNQIYRIVPRFQRGTWIFDDESRGVKDEPFVGGADTLITVAVAEKGIRNACDGFALTFSCQEFPGFDMKLDWVRRGEGGVGDWYRVEKYDREGWLCPCLLRYFERAPKTIFAKFEALT